MIVLRRALALLVERVSPDAREVRIPIADLADVPDLGIDDTQRDEGEPVLVLALGDKR